MSSFGGSLTLSSSELEEIAKIQALTPAQLHSLNKTTQYEYAQILAAYDDLVADNTKNAKYAAYFAAAMGGIMVLFFLAHWTRWSYRRIGPRKPGVIFAVPVGTSRFLRSLTIRTIPGFTSFGHFCVILVYVATMATLMFYNVTYWSDLYNWAHRLGWLAICNIALLTFLALKNTPLAFLTAYSYERLNCLHQVAGYTTVICVIMHGVVYTVALNRGDQLSLLTESAQISGEVAGVSMLITGLAALLLRRWHYEAFYAIHIVFFVVILITVGLHRADTSLGYAQNWSVAAVIVAAGLWALDRAIRVLRLWWNGVGNTAVISPLPQGGTRVTLQKTPATFIPGKHAFLWLPSIRIAETHPFTIVSTHPLEFVISAHNGFTHYLHALALQNPGALLRASVEGAYGTHPDFGSFDRVVLIAGGSGASFALGIAAALVQHARLKHRMQIDLLWVVRRPEQLSWFGRNLQILASSRFVNISIYSTTSSSATDYPVEDLLKYDVQGNKLSSSPMGSLETDQNGDIELGVGSHSPLTISVQAGRPDVSAFIESCVGNSGKIDKVIISACGPAGMMKAARNSVAQCVGGGGRSIVYHGEQFGW